MTKVTLSRPITHDGRAYDALDIDEPTVGAIEAYENAKVARKGDMTAMIEMLAHDLDMPADAVRCLRSSDMARIAEVLGPLAAGFAARGAGAPSSPTAPTS